MDTASIRQKLFDFLRYAEDKKLKAIYTMVESGIREERHPWTDASFLDEMERRTVGLGERKSR